MPPTDQQPPLTHDQLAVLRRYAVSHGREWKADLASDWEMGTYPDSSVADEPILRQLKDAPNFGQRGLDAFSEPFAEHKPWAYMPV
jgi:hypothetical protein